MRKICSEVNYNYKYLYMFLILSPHPAWTPLEEIKKIYIV